MMSAVTLFDDPQPVKLTVDDFDVLHRAGALEGHRHAELIEGVVVSMSPQRSRHSRIASDLYFLVRLRIEAVGSSLIPLMGPTVAMPPFNAPEPDLVLIDVLPNDGYVPLASVLLVAEVSDSTLRHDLSLKRDIYARAEIPEYWVVDAANRTLHQFWQPEGGTYRQVRAMPLGGELRSVTLPDLAIDSAGL